MRREAAMSFDLIILPAKSSRIKALARGRWPCGDRVSGVAEGDDGGAGL